MDSSLVPLLPSPMVHTGHPSSGPRSGAASARHSLSTLCRCGSSDPLLSAFLRPLSRKCHPACAERSRSERSNSRFRPCRKGSTFLRSSLATRLPRVSKGHSPLATIPFRITSFTDHRPLTPIESNLYKKRGGGWGPEHFPLFPSGQVCDAQQRSQPQSFHALTSRFSGYPGGGGLPFSSARLRALCVSALSFSVLRPLALAERRSPQ
jgi:hypothetical protein